MKTEVRRDYEVVVYPYEDDEEEYGVYRLSIRNTLPGVIEMHITDTGLYDDRLYLTDTKDSILFLDPSNLRGTLIRKPFDGIDSIYEQIEEIDDYDEYQCAVLASAVNLACHDVFGCTETGINSWEG